MRKTATHISKRIMINSCGARTSTAGVVPPQHCSCYCLQGLWVGGPALAALTSDPCLQSACKPVVSPSPACSLMSTLSSMERPHTVEQVWAWSVS